MVTLPLCLNLVGRRLRGRRSLLMSGCEVERLSACGGLRHDNDVNDGLGDRRRTSIDLTVVGSPLLTGTGAVLYLAPGFLLRLAFPFLSLPLLPL